jgi:Ni,Fe-hydrogenase maturation factor
MAKRALRVTKINLDELPIELNSEHVESLEDFDFFEFLKFYQTRSHFAIYIILIYLDTEKNTPVLIDVKIRTGRKMDI